MGKVAGVSAVKVSLNDGLTVLDFKPGNTVTIANLRQIIRNNGFVTKEARVIASGTMIANGDQLILEVAGSGEKIVLSSGASTTPGRLVITGKADLSDPKAIRMTVTSVQNP